MDTNERKQLAAKLFTDLQELMLNLYSRWQDEKEYENIEDYATNIKTQVEKIGGKFLRMTARPFGFEYGLGGAIYKVTLNSEQYAYKRVV